VLIDEDDPRVLELSTRLNLDPEFIEAHDPGRVVGATLEEVADNLITYLRSGLCMDYVMWKGDNGIELELHLNLTNGKKQLGVGANPYDPFEEYVLI
jgi:hypothetical protein